MDRCLWWTSLSARHWAIRLVGKKKKWLVSTEATWHKTKKRPHPLSENSKTRREQWPNPQTPTDWMSMNAFFCVQAYDWHTHTQSVLCLCVLLRHMWQARSSCLCLLMCNCRQTVVLFIDITAPCPAYCAYEGCEASSYFIGQLHSVLVFFYQAPALMWRLWGWIFNMPACVLWTHTSSISLLSWHTGSSALVGGILLLIFTNNAVLIRCLYANSKTNSQALSVWMEGSFVGFKISHNCEKRKKKWTFGLRWARRNTVICAETSRVFHFLPIPEQPACLVGDRPAGLRCCGWILNCTAVSATHS